MMGTAHPGTGPASPLGSPWYHQDQLDTKERRPIVLLREGAGRGPLEPAQWEKRKETESCLGS